MTLKPTGQTVFIFWDCNVYVVVWSSLGMRNSLRNTFFFSTRDQRLVLWHNHARRRINDTKWDDFFNTQARAPCSRGTRTREKERKKKNRERGGENEKKNLTFSRSSRSLSNSFCRDSARSSASSACCCKHWIFLFTASREFMPAILTLLFKKNPTNKTIILGCAKKKCAAAKWVKWWRENCDKKKENHVKCSKKKKFRSFWNVKKVTQEQQKESRRGGVRVQVISGSDGRPMERNLRSLVLVLRSTEALWAPERAMSARPSRKWSDRTGGVTSDRAGTVCERVRACLIGTKLGENEAKIVLSFFFGFF